MYGNLGILVAAAALSAMSNATPEELEERRIRNEAYAAKRAAEEAAREAARHPATKSKPRSASLERMLGKRKK